MSLVKYTFFDTRPKVGELQLYPLTAGRLIVLEQRGNPLAGVGVDDEPDPFALYEALLVASMASEELAEMCQLEERDWKIEVNKFAFDLSDDVINSFQEVIEAEMDAIQSAQTKPKKKAVRRRAKVAKT